MNDFKEFVLTKLEVLHIKLNYRNPYDLNTSKGLIERLEDIAKFDQLSEVVRENPEWDSGEFSKELSERIKKKTTYW